MAADDRRSTRISRKRLSSGFMCIWEAAGADGRPFRGGKRCGSGFDLCARPKRRVRTVSEWAKRPLINATASQWIYPELMPNGLRVFTAVPLSEPKIAASVFETEICEFRQDRDRNSPFSIAERTPWPNSTTCIRF